MTDIRFLGHSCFELSDGRPRVVLIDPFLKPNNPVATVTADEVEPDAILVTHGHVDHLADAVGLAQRTGATCAAIVELANWLGEQGVEDVLDPNLGGTVDFDWGWAKLVQAWHTNTMPGSDEAPFSRDLRDLDRQRRGLGDQHRRQDRLPPRRHGAVRRPRADREADAGRRRADPGRRPLHDGSPRRRLSPRELIGAATVIPMHHTTFPPIQTDLGAFKEDVERETDSTVVLLEPGETHPA